MQALILKDTLHYCRDYPLPEPMEGEARIRLKLAGICSTDLELVKGYAGFSGVPGHEFVGVVESVNSEIETGWVGQRVVGSINIGCRHCATCRDSGPEHCPLRRVLGIRGKDGVFADYFTLPVANLYRVPDSVPDEAAVFTEPLAAALRVIDQLNAFSVDDVAVIGPGRLGILVAKVLALAGYSVTVAGRSEASLSLPETWGLTTILVDLIPNSHFDCVVDASGQSGGFVQALRILKPRGLLVSKSTFVGNEPIDLSKIVVDEIHVLGSRCGPFAKALDALCSGDIPVKTMIDGRYDLSDGLTAFRHAARGGVRKILFSA